jgi:putative ABC transport system permease protein
VKYAPFVLANLRRNPLRTLLTGMAILLAVLLVCILLTMPSGLDGFLDNIASDTRISVHNKAGIVYQMPHSFTRKVRQLEGVEAAAGQSWFGGAFEEAGQVTFPNFAIEAEHVGAVWPDYAIPQKQLDDFKRYRDGALVGTGTMKKYGWKIGDRITLKSTVFPVNLDFRIVGEIPRSQAPMLWFSREYLDQALKAAGRDGLGTVGVIWVKVADPSKVNDLMRTIDEMSRNSEAETATETEKSFFSSFFGSLQGFARIILLVTGLVALCIVFIAANTASMGVRERAPEIAILKAIGFGRKVVFGTILAEAIILSSLAGGAGTLLALGFTRLLQSASSWNPQFGPLATFVLTPAILVEGLFLALFVGMLAGFVPSYGAARKPVVEALHEVF